MKKKSFYVETDMSNMTIWILFFGLHRHVRCLRDGRNDWLCANFWCSIRRCSWDRAILPMSSSLEMAKLYINAVEYWVGNTSGARGPHGKDVETMEKSSYPIRLDSG
jgi:hypothetical protein